MTAALDPPGPNPDDLHAAHLLARAFALAQVRPSWDAALLSRSNQQPQPLPPDQLAALVREITLYTGDLRLVADRLLHGRRDGVLDPDDVAEVLPAVSAFHLAAETHLGHMREVLDFLLGPPGTTPS